MRHATEGVLRRIVDEPDGVVEADRAHVAGCDTCRAALDDVRFDAERVAAALADDGPPAGGVDDAWLRLSTMLAAGTEPTAVPRLANRVGGGRHRRRGSRRPVVAGAAVAFVIAGATAAAANDWFQIFRAERVEPVAFGLDDLNTVPDLEAYGDLEVTGRPGVRPAADEGSAEAATGLDVPEVASLPRNVADEPEYRVGDEVSATFTFSADEAEQAAARLGAALPAPPPGLDGGAVRLVAGPGVAAMYPSRSGAPALLVARAVAPTAFSSTGLPFEEVRDYLLSLPGLPEEVAGPLRAFNADSTTLPLPVPAERFDASPVDVGGRSATLLESRDGTLAAVVWVDDGEVTVVAGPLDAGEVLAVAREVR